MFVQAIRAQGQPWHSRASCADGCACAGQSHTADSAGLAVCARCADSPPGPAMEHWSSHVVAAAQVSFA